MFCFFISQNSFGYICAMKFFRFTILLIFICILNNFSIAQKINSNIVEPHHVDLRVARSVFNCGKLENPDSLAVVEYLYSVVPNLRVASLLQNSGFYQSKHTLHYRFQQTYNTIPVYRATIKINLDRNRNILSVFDNSYFIPSTPEGEFPAKEVVEEKVKKLYSDKANLERIKIENIYFHNGQKMLPASRIEIWDKQGDFFELIIDENSEVIYQRDLNMYFSANSSAALDTPAIARVFNPDPLTTAGVVYGTPYEDANDADIPQLNMQREQVVIDVLFENDTFKLESSYCKITEHSIPVVPPTTSLTPDFEFTRSQSGFEDVNAFYHINFYQNYLRQLGFTDIVNYPIWVDTHGMGGADNSNFSAAGSPPRLSFGEGGVDDAEDADVVIHEYGHAISHSAAPNTNAGIERNAIDEALGDYFAASYSKAINTFGWERVFSWDGHNEFWNGRIVNSNKHYPEDKQNHIYKDAEIWSSTLMQINEQIGREKTDEILIESMRSYEANMTMNDAACLLLQSAETIFGWQDALAVSYYLAQRGFSGCGIGMNENIFAKIQLLNTFAFAEGTGDAILRFEKPATGKLGLFDARGKLIFTKSFTAVSEVKINSQTLNSGIFLMNVETENLTGNFKLMKW